MSIYTSLHPLGDVQLMVSYTYTPGEPAQGPESRMAGPAEPARAIVTSVYIWNSCMDAGAEVPASFFSVDWLRITEENILAEHEE